MHVPVHAKTEKTVRATRARNDGLTIRSCGQSDSSQNGSKDEKRKHEDAVRTRHEDRFVALPLQTIPILLVGATRLLQSGPSESLGRGNREDFQ